MFDDYVSVQLDSALLDFVAAGLEIGGTLSQGLLGHVRSRPGALTTFLPSDHDPARLGDLHEGGMADVETGLDALAIHCNQMLLTRGGMLVAEDPVRRRGNSNLPPWVAYYNDEVYWYRRAINGPPAVGELLRAARGPVHGTFAMSDCDLGNVVGPTEWSRGDLDQIVAGTWLVGMPAYDGETSVLWRV